MVNMLCHIKIKVNLATGFQRILDINGVRFSSMPHFLCLIKKETIIDLPLQIFQLTTVISLHVHHNPAAALPAIYRSLSCL